MNNRTLPRLAAALAIAPLGFLAAQSASAQQFQVQVTPAVVAPSPAAIERFVVRTDGPVQPGRELRFRLHGTPGARVHLEIPGVARGLAMVETRPGVYQTAYVVRRGDTLRGFENASATLQFGPTRVMARADADFDRWARRDRVAPEITELTPAQGQRVGERGRTRLSARIQDEGSGVDLNSVVLRVNGRDVTRQARISGDEVRFRDDFAPGRHVAELSVRDHAGNVSRRSWSFVVTDGERYGYYR